MSESFELMIFPRHWIIALFLKGSASTSSSIQDRKQIGSSLKLVASNVEGNSGAWRDIDFCI